jgi:hypothetical protein
MTSEDAMGSLASDPPSGMSSFVVDFAHGRASGVFGLIRK